MTEKSYRFLLTLDGPTRRKLALLMADSVTPSGRMRTAADIIRELIRAAPLTSSKETE